MNFVGGIGRLNGIHGEPGTVLGPDSTGQWFSILSNDETGCDIKFATADDMQAIGERDSQSVTEVRLRTGRKPEPLTSEIDVKRLAADLLRWTRS